MSIVNFKPYLNQKIRQKNCNQKYFKLKILSKEKEVNEMRDRIKNFNLSTFLIFYPCTILSPCTASIPLPASRLSHYT